MKATLEFNLDDPNDRKAHLRAVKSLDMAIVLFELIHNSEKEVFNTIENTSISVIKAVELVYEEIYAACEANNINIDELID